MLKGKKALFCVLFILISGLFNVGCFMGYTLPSMINFTNKHKFDVMVKDPLNINVYKFDYFAGVYLIGSILMIVLLLILFDFPSFKDIYCFVKKEFKNNVWLKIKEKRKEDI